MNVHIDPDAAERQKAEARQTMRRVLAEHGPGVEPPRFGVGDARKQAQYREEKHGLRLINGPGFDPAHAPEGALMIPLADVGKNQCRWIYGEGAAARCCGLPVDREAGKSLIRKNWCAYHGARAARQGDEA